MSTKEKSLKSKIMWRIQRNAHNIRFRDLLSSITRLSLPKPQNNPLGYDSLSIRKTRDEILQDLRENGYSDLGITIDSETIERLKKSFDKLSCYDTGSPNTPMVNLASPSDDTQLAHYSRKDLSRIPEVVKMANDKKILEVVGSYFNVKPTISNINCWWSFGKRKTAKEAQLFHRDLDDFKFVKLFLYLTDVTETSGPHIYVKGSHRKNQLIDLRRFTDSEVISTFGEENIISFVKPKGSCFLVDTYGIHKGLVPKDADRLLMQFQYSYFPLPVEHYEPLESSPIQNIDFFTNRLLFKKV